MAWSPTLDDVTGRAWAAAWVDGCAAIKVSTDPEVKLSVAFPLVTGPIRRALVGLVDGPTVEGAGYRLASVPLLVFTNGAAVRLLTAALPYLIVERARVLRLLAEYGTALVASEQGENE